MVGALRGPLTNDWLAYRERKKHLSVSQLLLWEQCPASWWWKYVKKAPDSPTPQLGFGTAVHAGIEHMWKRMNASGIVPSLEELYERFKAVLREELPDAGALTWEAYTHQGLQLLMAYRDDTAIFFGREPREKWPIILPEHSFDDFKVEGCRWPIAGRVDLTVRFESGSTIVDYKTTGRDPDPKAARRNPQLLLYAARHEVVHGDLPSKLRQLYLQRKTGQLFWSDCRVVRRDIESVLERFRKMSRAMLEAEDQLAFPMRPKVKRFCSPRNCAFHHLRRDPGPCPADIPRTAPVKKGTKRRQT